MKKKVLFIFALLCTVAQGAWAETINLSTVNADVTANDGDVLTGTTSHKVSIAADATVTRKRLLHSVRRFSHHHSGRGDGKRTDLLWLLFYCS